MIRRHFLFTYLSQNKTPGSSNISLKPWDKTYFSSISYNKFENQQSSET